MANPPPKTAQLLPPELIERRILSDSRPQGDAQSRSRDPLSSRAPSVGAGGEAQFGPVPLRFHVSVEPSGVQKVEITNCDFKLGWSAARTALRVHRARRSDAVERPPKPTRDPSEHRYQANLRSAPRNAHDAQGSRPEAGSPGTKIRRAIQGRVRCDTRADGAFPSPATAPDRFWDASR